MLGTAVVVAEQVSEWVSEVRVGLIEMRRFRKEESSSEENGHHDHWIGMKET